MTKAQLIEAILSLSDDMPRAHLETIDSETLQEILDCSSSLLIATVPAPYVAAPYVAIDAECPDLADETDGEEAAIFGNREWDYNL